MGKTRDLFKKIRDTKGMFHAKMGQIKDRNSMALTEAEDIKRWQKYTEELYEKDPHDPDNHNVSKAVSQLPEWASRLQVNQLLHSCFQRIPCNLANVNTLLFYYLESEYVNKIENMIHLLCFKVFKNASIWHYVRGNWDSFADDINILKIWILLND